MDKKTKLMLLACGGVGVIAVIVFLFSFNTSKKPEKPIGQTNVPTIVVKTPNPTTATLPQILQVTFSYEPTTTKLTVNRMVLTNGNTEASENPSSPYELTEIDSDNNVLFHTRFSVDQFLYVDSPYNRSGMKQSSTAIPTTIAVPYNANATRIVVTKDTNVILSFTPIK